MNLIANTPTPPNHAVIFSSHQNGDLTGYAEMAEKMLKLMLKQRGYLGVKSARSEFRHNGFLLG